MRRGVIGSLLVLWLISSFVFRVVSIFIPGVYVASFFSAALFLLIWGLTLVMIGGVVPGIENLAKGCVGFIIGGVYFYVLSLFVPGVAISGIFAAIILSIVFDLGLKLVM